MAYDLSTFQSQLQDLSRQYQQLASNQPVSNYAPQPPQAIPQIPIPVSSRQVQYVSGMMGAKKYQQERLTPNSSEIIMDKDENIFYLVSKDANGIPSSKISAARFEIIQEEEEEPLVLTRKEFDNFKQELKELLSHREPDHNQPVGRPIGRKEDTK